MYQYAAIATATACLACFAACAAFCRTGRARITAAGAGRRRERQLADQPPRKMKLLDLTIQPPPAMPAAGAPGMPGSGASPIITRRNHRGRHRVDQGMPPGHKITITPASHHLEITLGGEKLAVTDRPVLLDETGLPTRYYVPREDIRTDLLRPSSLETTCPFKGQASYWSVSVGDEVHENLAWSYETPIPSAEGIAGLLCFYPERVELTIDGELQPSSA